MDEKAVILRDVLAATRRHDLTGGLRERVIEACAAKWPEDICATLAGHQKYERAMMALLDVPAADLLGLADQLGIVR